MFQFLTQVPLEFLVWKSAERLSVYEKKTVSTNRSITKMFEN
jgi:hypothetical protein